MLYKLRNPNRVLINYALGLTAINLISYLLGKYEIIVGLGFIVRIFVLLWIPKAAKLTARKHVLWTILSFISPSAGMFILGYLGYKRTPEINQVEKELQKQFQEKRNGLKQSESQHNELAEKVQVEISELIKELDKTAIEMISEIYDKKGVQYLTKQLEKQGYILDNKSEALVDVNGACPACGANVAPNDTKCAECGLEIGA
ncbi:MAG: hypothetical protein JXA77_03665 [Bacteroidales bacterium]|nr:hypothetical protein [Bacteroidales bacterium]MBN2818469.1 hypothetical protein [Bacteroidales bacterium]